MIPFSRRQFLAMAAAGRLSGPEWKTYPDPATELQVVRLTDPAFISGTTATHLRQFTRHSDFLLYWSERYGQQRQAFLLDLKRGDSKQLTGAESLDPSSLSISNDERNFVFFDGPVLKEASLGSTRARDIHTVPDGAARTGLTIAADGAIVFAERENGTSRLLSILRSQPRRVVETDRQIEEVMARPRRPQILYRAGGQLWIVNANGSGRRQLKTAPGQIGEALWTPSGRTLVYLHIPEDRKELITLREHAPDAGNDGADKKLAETSQYISFAPNADASVFTGASRSKASAYVLILLRVTRRELTLCEHRASNPAMVRPVFSPDSQSILFVSDRHGKPALYQMHVGRFVEETGGGPE